MDNIKSESIQNIETVISIEEFSPEIYDCEDDGACGSGHVHVCK